MRISKRGWLLALSLSTVSARNACSAQQTVVPAPPVADLAVPVITDEAQIEAAADQAEKSGNGAAEKALRATNGALTAEANSAAKDAECAKQEAEAAANEAFASTPNDTGAGAKAKAAAQAAKKSKEASDKAIAASKAAKDALAPSELQKMEIKQEKKLAKNLSEVIDAELAVANDSFRPTNERVSAIEVLNGIAIGNGDLTFYSLNGKDRIATIETMASHVVVELLKISSYQSLSVAKFQLLAEVLSSSGKDVFEGDNEVFLLAINEMVRSAQNDEPRVQRVSSSALAAVLTNANVDKGDYLKKVFPELVKQVTDLIKTHTNSQVRLGLLTALAEKGSEILKQEKDVASAEAARMKSDGLKSKFIKAESTYQAAVSDKTNADNDFTEATSAVDSARKTLSEKINKVTEVKIKLQQMPSKETADALKIAEQDLAIWQATKEEQERTLTEAAKAKSDGESQMKTEKEARDAAKAAYDTAKADADAKAKAKPVAEEALPIVLAALRDLLSSSTPTDRVRVEARYALAQFLQGQLLPEPMELKFTAGSTPTDRQPLAASDRPGVSSINSERMGVTHTRSFNAAQDMTNRAERGTRVAAPPQSLRIPGTPATFSTDAPEVERASGGTRVKVPEFVPGTMPSPAAPAKGITNPPDSSSSGSSP